MPDYLPVHKRPFITFLSHASVDKPKVVDEIYQWLSFDHYTRDEARREYQVWYDKKLITGGQKFATVLSDAIPQCRSMLVVVSQSSVKSGWVEEEFNLGLDHSQKNPGFKMIPIRIDDAQVPGFLANRHYLEMAYDDDGKPTLDFYDALLKSLHPGDIFLDQGNSRDIYASFGWRPDEQAYSQSIMLPFIKLGYGFRLIGDSEDRKTMLNEPDRVERIIDSCGGLLAILPFRADKTDAGYTSKYIFHELEIALEAGLPVCIFAEKSSEKEAVVIPDDILNRVPAENIYYVPRNLEASHQEMLQNAVRQMENGWRAPRRVEHFFFATAFKNMRNDIIVETVKRVTGLDCVMGQSMRSSHAQYTIVEQIQDALMVVADLSNQDDSGLSSNVLIEVGVARGAKVPYELASHQAVRERPFMLEDREFFYYRDDAELLRWIHHMVYPYRKRVINYELDDN